MDYKIGRAIRFATQVHEVDQKQKRKGKDIPYITHPLTVGIILARAGVSEDIVAAGILHDTMEDSAEEKKVTREIIAKEFGEEVAALVDSVTEQDKSLSWEERKHEALRHIKDFSHGSLLVKSADVISNISELLEDHKKDGDEIFSRFNAPKEKIIQHYLQLIRIMVERWPENQLAHEMTFLAGQLQMEGSLSFMLNHRAKIVEYRQYDENEILECPICNWHGTAEGHREYYDDLFDVSCPICGKMILIVSYSLAHPDKS